MSAIDSDTAAGSAFRAMVAAVDRGMLACTSESGTSMRLMHHLERFAEDAPALLVTCIAGGDRVPLISGLRTSVLESMRAYIHAAACCALERDCTRPEAAAAVLIGMAHCGCADLLASDVNSTHAPLGDQNPAHWAVLRRRSRATARTRRSRSRASCRPPTSSTPARSLSPAPCVG